jgi:1,5-anhydro-D-fructose reductase (1,5-anhydro-D-mannitol-forming)
MVNVGVCGYGKVGKIRHEVLHRLGYNVSKIYDPYCESDQNNIFVESIDDIVKDNSIVAVFICVPNKYNAEYTCKFLNAGKHVFCEKPPALTCNELQKVLDVSNENPNLKLMYGFNHRHHHSIKKTKEYIDGGSLGKILWMRGRYGKEIKNKDLLNWRFEKSVSGGGILLDQGIHLLDLLLYFSGGFDKVHSFLSNTCWDIPMIEDNAFIIMKNNKNGIVASMHSTMAQWRYLFSLEIFMQNGSIILNGLRTPSGSYGDEVVNIYDKTLCKEGEKISQEIFYSCDESWDYEVKDFMNCIENDLKVEGGSIQDSMSVMSIVEKIYKENNYYEG